MKRKKTHNNKRRQEAIEYLNVPAWEQDKEKAVKRKKKFNVPFSSTEKQKINQIEDQVEKFQPVTKKGKKKKILQILFLVVCSGLSIGLLAFTGDNGVDTPFIEVWQNMRTGYLLIALLMLGIVILFDSLKFIYLTQVTTNKFRPFLSFKIGIIGRYYDCITPLGMGSQPFQIFYLSKRDVPVGVATSIPMLKFFLGQIAVLLIAFGLILFTPLDSGLGLGVGVLSAVKTTAIVGLSVDSFIPFFITFISLMPIVGKKITGGILKIGSKLKIVKNYEETYTKVISHVGEFQTSMRYVSSNIVHILALILLTVVEYVCYLAIPYYICLAFGSQPSWEFFFTVLALNAITQFAVSLVPTPGNSGASEALFLVVFKNLFPTGAFWAMLIWRFLTYYSFIILGMIINLYDFIKQATKEKFIERRRIFSVREMLIPKLNTLPTSEERLANIQVLKQIEDNDKFFAPKSRENDIKVSLKTDYSYMPFTPSYLAYKLYENGARIGGIMDYDTVASCKEFAAAAETLGFKPLSGVEVKTYISRTRKRDIRINNIYQKDIINLQMISIPEESLDKVDAWLEKIRLNRNERNIAMVDIINKKYRSYGISINFNEDVLPISRMSKGGTVTEWHLLYALAQKIIERFGRGQILLRFVTQELGINLTERSKHTLIDVTGNETYVYDLINAIKSEIKSFYIDATKECCSILEFVKLAREVGAVVVYPYMGDIVQNILGEYRVDKFEDSFLTELLTELKDIGVNAVSIEPSRLTDEQTNRILKLCDTLGLMPLSGENIYSIRQKFASDIFEEEKFGVIHNATWALCGNIKALESSKDSGMFSKSTVEKYPELNTRIMIYSTLGRYGKRTDTTN